MNMVIFGDNDPSGGSPIQVEVENPDRIKKFEFKEYSAVYQNEAGEES